MKTYRIQFDKQAQKFINSRNKKEKQRILHEIYKLPFGSDIKRMKGFDNRYRLRVGDFRIIYEVNDGILLILVLDIGNRGDIYK